jgi:hypothetical protein
MGEHKEAVVEEREKIVSLSGSPELAASIEEDFAKSGYRGVLAKLAEWLDRNLEAWIRLLLQHRPGIHPYGEKEKAFSWLERAYEEHDSGLVSLGVEPMFAACGRILDF